MTSDDIARELWAHETYEDGRAFLDEALREYTEVIRHRALHGWGTELVRQREME